MLTDVCSIFEFAKVRLSRIIGGNSGSRVVNRTTSSSASFSTAIFNRWFSTAFTPTRKPGLSQSILPPLAKRCEKSMTQARLPMEIEGKK